MEFTRQEGTIDDVSVIKAAHAEALERLKRKEDRPPINIDILHGKVTATFETIQFDRAALGEVLAKHEPDLEGKVVEVTAIKSGGVSIRYGPPAKEEAPEEPEGEAEEEG
ncbi:hypothetical protein LCGC14_2079270 [marine sediment metagenome]|uniref:Uncharacterized protein n=1 Tax=marine sediment metagenome TaxID=412755 RepID=A0A0F9F3E6_9ZZZZ